jgi:hypothetical protein
MATRKMLKSFLSCHREHTSLLEMTHTGIDSTAAKTTIEHLLERERKNLPSDFPRDLLIETIRIIMPKNIFQSEGTFWLQKRRNCNGNTRCSKACNYCIWRI